MPTVHELDYRQIADVLSDAANRQVPVTLTVQQDGRWANYPSRLLSFDGTHLTVERPTAGLCVEGESPTHEFVPAEKIGISLKLKHYKHLFSTTVVGLTQVALPEGLSVSVLTVCSPIRMHRLQRRVYTRVSVPANRIVRVSFWLGSCNDEPANTSEASVWCGTAADLSAGGLSILCDPDVAACLEVGDAVGVRLMFGAANEIVYADAQYRHADPCEGKALLGFQFVGLGQTPLGRKALDLLSSKVAEYQRIEERAANGRP